MFQHEPKDICNSLLAQCCRLPMHNAIYFWLIASHARCHDGASPANTNCALIFCFCLSWLVSQVFSALRDCFLSLPPQKAMACGSAGWKPPISRGCVEEMKTTKWRGSLIPMEFLLIEPEVTGCNSPQLVSRGVHSAVTAGGGSWFSGMCDPVSGRDHVAQLNSFFFPSSRAVRGPVTLHLSWQLFTTLVPKERLE